MDSAFYLLGIRVMAKRMMIVAAAFALILASCGGPSTPSEGPSTQKAVYRCLSSSCDTKVICNEGDPVPEHGGKPMIR